MLAQLVEPEKTIRGCELQTHDFVPPQTTKRVFASYSYKSTRKRCHLLLFILAIKQQSAIH